MRIVAMKGSCGIAAGAGKVYDAIVAEIAKFNDVELGSTGCIGMCFLEPIVDIYEGKDLVRRLVKVAPENAEAIVAAVRTGDLSKVDDITISDDDAEFLRRQTRIALRHCGLIDPTSLADYRAADGYVGLEKVLKTMTPESVINILKDIKKKEGVEA